MAFMEELQHLKILLEDIKLATNNFDDSNLIGSGGFRKVYKGELTHFKGKNMVALKRLDRKYGQGDREFLKEIVLLSRYTHENLISLLGFSNEGDERILVYEYASRTLTWRQRLKICLSAAKGLSYLHDPNTTHQRVLHCDVKSSNILLDENLNAKVSDFGLSKIGPSNQQYTFIVTNAVGTPGYCDPQYMETYTLTKESDVYSFGVVLFEVLCGRLCFKFVDSRLSIFVPMWKQKYKENKLHEIIFQDLKQQMASSSLKSFLDIAYQCLHKSREKRPTMGHVLEKLEIALEYQESYEEKRPLCAKVHEDMFETKEKKVRPSFDVTELASYEGFTRFLSKARDKRHISKQVSLEDADHGFCNDCDERILVYEYASHGSLDRHLSDGTLTWMQRLKICLAAAMGISYLHDPSTTYQRVLHCDIKSSNILLDECWNAKVSDFGLSKIGSSNQPYTFLVTNAVGTLGYCDPQYMETYTLTKESDIYSFGVVLFEVLCGRLCFEYVDSHLRVYVPMWKQKYKENKLDEIIFEDLKQQMVSSSLKSFSDVAYQCLHKSREKRPTMVRVHEKLEIALEFQQSYEEKRPLREQHHEDMTPSEVRPLNYISEAELKPEEKAADWDVCDHTSSFVFSSIFEEERAEMKMDMPPEMETDMPTEMKRDMLPEMETDMPTEIKRDMPPEMKRDMPPEMETDMPPEMKRDMPPVMECDPL